MILARICDKTADSSDSSVNVPATDENFLISVGIVQSISIRFKPAQELGAGTKVAILMD